MHNTPVVNINIATKGWYNDEKYGNLCFISLVLYYCLDMLGILSVSPTEYDSHTSGHFSAYYK